MLYSVVRLEEDGRLLQVSKGMPLQIREYKETFAIKR
jgi:hypothetical protein